MSAVRRPLPAPASTRSKANAGLSRTQDAGHLGDLLGEQLAEQRTDVDAGKKIARASRALDGAGVVAEVGMIERGIHERGHRHGAAFADPASKSHRNLHCSHALFLADGDEDLAVAAPDENARDAAGGDLLQLAAGV